MLQLSNLNHLLDRQGLLIDDFAFLSEKAGEETVTSLAIWAPIQSLLLLKTRKNKLCSLIK